MPDINKEVMFQRAYDSLPIILRFLIELACWENCSTCVTAIVGALKMQEWKMQER